MCVCVRLCASVADLIGWLCDYFFVSDVNVITLIINIISHRDAMGLPKFESFEEVNPWINKTNPKLMRRFRDAHNGNISTVSFSQ